jgi:hypothetical protein
VEDLFSNDRVRLAPASQTSFLKVYTSYINNFDNSITTLAKLKQSNDNFSAYLSVPAGLALVPM